MGDTKINGLLDKLDAAWKEAIAKHASVKALVRISGDKHKYVAFIEHHTGNLRGESRNDEDQFQDDKHELASKYKGIPFAFMVLHSAGYEDYKQRLAPKCKEGKAKIVYENGREPDA